MRHIASMLFPYSVPHSLKYLHLATFPLYCIIQYSLFPHGRGNYPSFITSPQILLSCNKVNSPSFIASQEISFYCNKKKYPSFITLPKNFFFLVYNTKIISVRYVTLQQISSSQDTKNSSKFSKFPSLF
jgi:hypothetical protein